jgi:pyridoxamine 5'-phosphate oxidase
VRAVFASRNPHKYEQVVRLLPEIELVSLDSVTTNLVLDEPYESYVDNALAKARVVAGATGMPAIADDSGLEVEALSGSPGVRSARWAGDAATDADNNSKLVEAVRGIPESDRSCRYRCAAVLVVPGGTELVAEGRMEGRVVLDGKGSLGFGYDPHVVPAGESRTMGEIPLEEKLTFSHRGRAFTALGEEIRRYETSEKAKEYRTERRLATLEESDADSDPFAQFELWLRAAFENESGEPNAMTIATATRDGRPSSRVVLLRGFDDRGFTFYTNYESRKARELAENPQAALVFYWGTLQRQVRVTGGVAKLPAEESAAYFERRPRGSRVGAWASPQSRIISGRAELDARVAEVEDEFLDKDVPLPPFWGGYRIMPDTIEFWQGRPDRLHDRLRYTRSDDGWVIERLAP